MSPAGTQAMGLADAARFVVTAAAPGATAETSERVARLILLDVHHGRRAALLRKAALNLRNDPDGLRQLQRAREVLLHPASPSSESAKAEHLDHHTSKEH